MNRLAAYTVLFAVCVLLQVFLCNNLGLGVYVTPLAYVVFVMLLPMDMSAGRVMLLGFLLGMTVDFFSGTAGLNTIAMGAVSFLRRGILTLVAGKEEVAEGGIPSVRRLGYKKYLLFAVTMVGLQCALYFTFEAAGFGYFYLTLLRIACSAAVSLALAWLITGVFLSRIHNVAKSD